MSKLTIPGIMNSLDSYMIIARLEHSVPSRILPNLITIPISEIKAVPHLVHGILRKL